MKDRIQVCFNALQELDIKPTPHNVSILNGVYETLRSVYSDIDKGKEGENVARQTVDSQRADND